MPFDFFFFISLKNYFILYCTYLDGSYKKFLVSSLGSIWKRSLWKCLLLFFIYFYLMISLKNYFVLYNIYLGWSYKKFLVISLDIFWTRSLYTPRIFSLLWTFLWSTSFLAIKYGAGRFLIQNLHHKLGFQTCWLELLININKVCN